MAKSEFYNLDTDTTLGGNNASDIYIASQKAVKSYVDSADSGKADVDLSNLSNGLANTICTTAATTTSSASSATPAVVKENYVNGTSWYRVYSDGWCEQGGKTTGNGSYGSTQVTLLKSYTDTSYSVLIAAPDLPTSNFTNSSSATVRGVMAIIGGVATKTTSSFLTASDQDICWEAKGYIA